MSSKYQRPVMFNFKRATTPNLQGSHHWALNIVSLALSVIIHCALSRCSFCGIYPSPSISVNVVPFPEVLFSVNFPLSLSTPFFTRYKPSPEPFEVEEPLKYISKTWLCMCSLMPMPLSSNTIFACLEFPRSEEHTSE